MHANGAISWSSKRQTTVSLSTAEADYVSAFEATKEAAWVQQLFVDITGSCDEPITLHVDNQSAFAIANNNFTSKRCKHMDIKYHYVREEIGLNHISTSYCPTDDMLADIFTKPLPRDKFTSLRERLGMR